MGTKEIWEDREKEREPRARKFQIENPNLNNFIIQSYYKRNNIGIYKLNPKP